MAISFIRSFGGFSSPGPTAVSNTVNVTAGDLIAVAVSCIYSQSAPTIAISDSAGNTYLPSGPQSLVSFGGVTLAVRLFYTICQSTGLCAVTFTPNVSNGTCTFLRLHCQQVSGISQISPLDQFTSSSGSGVGISSGNVSTNTDNEFLHGYGLDNNGNPTPTNNWLPGITEGGELDEYQIVVSKSNYAATYTGDGGTWCCLLATYNAATTANTTTTWSVIANRKDFTGQTFWTEWREGAVSVGGTLAQAGNFVLLGADGKISPSMLPTGSSSVSVNGTPVSNPNFNNGTPTAPGGFTNVIWQSDGSGNVSAYYATSGTVVTFGQVQSGTSVSEALIVGSNSTLTVANNGIIEATELATNTATPVTVNTSAPVHAGQVLVSQPLNASALWSDPLGMVTMTSGQVINAFQVVAVHADGLAYKADVTNAADADRIVGIAITSATVIGNTLQVQQIGKLDNPGFTFAPGRSVYLDLASALTQTVPTSVAGFAFELVVGVALSATRIEIQIGLPIILA